MSIQHCFRHLSLSNSWNDCLTGMKKVSYSLLPELSTFARRMKKPSEDISKKVNLQITGNDEVGPTNDKMV